MRPEPPDPHQDPTDDPPDPTGLARLRHIASEEFGPLFGRGLAGVAVTRLIPSGAMTRTRAMLLRRCGWEIGHGTVIASTPQLIGDGPLVARLSVGARAFINVGNVWELSDTVSIGDFAAIGQDVMLLTSSHRIGSATRRADELFTAPIDVGAGVWIGARSLVLPGVRIGDGALVAANTVVRHDVPDNVLFAGNPGRVIRPLDG